MSYVIGLDFGTESVRAVLLDAGTGATEATAVEKYEHGVMTQALPDGRILDREWALQHAPDYLAAMQNVLERVGSGRRVRSIGVACTASTPMPTRADGTPLSVLLPSEPHAYVKLWKHHAAQPQADRINAIGGAMLDRYGGRTSSEWSLAKAIQLAEESPTIWDRTERWIEAGDWIVWQLTGCESRSGCFAGYKAHYQPEIGYPDGMLPGYIARMAIVGAPSPIGSAAGDLTGSWHARTGIVGPTRIAVAVIDAHAIVPALGVTQPGTFVGTLGTSACYLLLNEHPVLVPGISGVVRDGAVPGFWCYEAGQPAFGDALAWYARAYPRASSPEASIEAYAAASAALPVGSDTLLALDWWNGCRCPHADTGLSGLIIGLTLASTPVEIFRALENSLCFGARLIRDNFAACGISGSRVVMGSGVAERMPTLVQRMADVLFEEIHVPRLAHATAVGAAIHGAVAAGVCPDFSSAAARFGAREFTTYAPHAVSGQRLGELYQAYRTLGSSTDVHAAMHSLCDMRGTLCAPETLPGDSGGSAGLR
jgi:L-ribulokinase